MKTLTTTNLGDFSVTITPDAQQAKADALALAATIKAASTVTEQQDCIAAASMCKSLIKGMEATRVEVKEPALAATRLIDTTAKNYSAELIAEATRLESMAAKYQAELNRIAAQARAEEEARQRKAAAEMERLRLEELAEKQKREQEAYEARQRDLAAIQAAKDEESLKAAQQAADDAAEVRARQVREQELLDAEMAEHRAEEARQRALTLAAIPTPKAQGARVRVSMDYELQDIHALYKARPDLVKMEPKRSDILAYIQIPNVALLPGIRVFESTKLDAKA